MSINILSCEYPDSPRELTEYFTTHVSFRELENRDYLSLMSQASSKDAAVAKKWKEIKKRQPVRVPTHEQRQGRLIFKRSHLSYLHLARIRS